MKKNNDVNLEDVFNEKFKKPKNAEIKLKFFAYGKHEFLEIAKSERLFTLFDFLKNNNVYIHISIFDYVYSFIIDIFDSLFHDEDFAQFYHSEFKDELYKVLLLEYESLLKLLYKYKFPNISSEDISNFINELLDLYEHCLYENFNDDSIDYFAKETLRQLIKSKRKIKELPFLQENEPFVLEDSLIQQYILKASIF